MTSKFNFAVFFTFLVIITIVLPSISFAAGVYPGSCYFVRHQEEYFDRVTVEFSQDIVADVVAGTVTIVGEYSIPTNYGAGYRATIQIYWYDSSLPYNNWQLKDQKQTYIKTSKGWPSVIDTLPESCPNPCSLKKDKLTYDLQNYSNPSSPPIAGNACYDDCQQSAEILWTDCIGSSCIASIKYRATGQSCGVETSVDNLQTDPPKRCTDEINAKIQQCGGSLHVLSFDFETCTGQCTPDSCADQWKTLVAKCGGVMAISTWDASTCSGTCVNDPLPDIKKPDSEAVPKNVTNETKTNSDGSSEVTKVIVYNVDGTSYTETTTSTYDSSGNQTSSTTSTSSSPASDSESFGAINSSGFTEPYTPGEFDIPARFTAFLNNVQSSGLFSFSNDFFNSLPGGGSPVYEIEAGSYGHHSIDLSATLSTGLAILKTILLACFGFLSIRAVIMKR